MKLFSSSLVVSICLAMMSVSCDKTRPDSVSKNPDTLFLGFSLGMDRKDFYQYCWEMNRRKYFTHGPTNENVEYKLGHALLKDSVTMRFYPGFYKDKIYEMPVTFTYFGWAPWNKQYWADSLLNHLVPVFEQWYGKLQVTDHKTMGKVFYRFDGKRRINLFKKDDQFVQAVFTDLVAEKELREEFEKQNEASSAQ